MMVKYLQLFNSLLNISLKHHRTFSSSCQRFGYEGPGKTTASFIDKEVGQFLMISSFTNEGFQLTNGAFAVGPIILFPSFIFRWKVKTIDDITPESLTLFRMMEPKIELLLLGVGHSSYYSSKSLMELRKNLKQITDLKIEIMSTKDAVAVYHFMLADFRVVAGAFLPMYEEPEKQSLIHPSITSE